MQADNIYIAIGKKLRSYRKVNNITLEKLAATINKSAATVSKYEKGEISMDVATLIELCNAFEITPSQLINETVYAPKKAKSQIDVKQFFRKSPLFLYWYNGQKKSICHGVVDMDYETLKATMFFDIKDLQNYHKCNYIFYGDMVCLDTFTRFSFANVNSKADIILLSFSNLASCDGYMIGHIFGMTYTYQNVSIKCLLSNHIIQNQEKLIETLKLSKDELNSIKTSNFFLV